MEAPQTVIQMMALIQKFSLQRDMMGIRRLLYHAHEGMERDTAKVACKTLAGEWKPLIGCSNAKAHQFSLPKTANERWPGVLQSRTSDEAPECRGEYFCDNIRGHLEPHEVDEISVRE